MFADRIDAGRQLARHLAHLRGTDVVVVGLPRGGVPVAAEVSEALGAPLDVIVVRKLGVPFQRELAMGAIGEGGIRVVNRDVVDLAGVSPEELAAVEAHERVELERRSARFRADRPRIALTGRTVVVVDDGVATGSTAKAACQVARAHGAHRVVLAVPVAPADWTARMGDAADEYVCIRTSDDFFGVGQFYQDFTQVDDDEVVELLRRASARRAPSHPAAGDPPWSDDDVRVPVGPVELEGHLTVPEGARGLVIFAHGSGSSRHSPRNRYVAAVLQQAGLATLLFDLLTPREELDRANVFDVELLGRRLAAVTLWTRRQTDLAPLPVGYFGASTGAAAALWAAAEPGASVASVVSRGGRPDLARPRLGAVFAPTLLIVGGQDTVVLGLNRDARAEFHTPCELAVVPGATHLFEEPGTLTTAAELARDWFLSHLASQPTAQPGQTRRA